MRIFLFLNILLFCLSFSHLQAQEKANTDVMQATYKLELLRDSLNPNSKRTLMTELLIYPNESWFRTLSRGVFDTLQYYQLPTRNRYSPRDEHELNYIINKNYNTGDIRYYSPLRAIFQDYCYYDEHVNQQDWKITTDTIVRNGITLQKATLNYSKRKWIAYFNKEIPINDGPYKFSGLPGLIFEISDEKGTWKFSLLRLIHSNHNSFNSNFLEKAKYMNKKEFHSLQRQLFENNVQDSEARGEITFRSADERQQAIERRKEKSKTYNNPIELIR
ncbi:GLPGLI family protein [Sphingobacterium sp. UDSM-2020]|uniref:GLPGLI family protein n=1 Tax=Sphingobacterium sp. UDSM-2020 TaxID=2795738 RepID=UPI001938404D|nr:GLPGLI family protein [Sphingobacterium sp. UDSM-2020]QQD11611.1 GLPGLI family protein [Sphingobacterium sp. UDSM-2020]